LPCLNFSCGGIRLPVSFAALQRIFQILLLLIGILFVGAVLGIAIARMGYPYELEWMEGGTLQTVQRLVTGLPIYVPPSMDYIPFIYTPLFFYVGAGLNQIMGEGFWALRLLSLLASVGSLGLIFSLVKNRTHSAFWGFMGAALFAACFEIGGGWLDLARVDTLHLFFLLLAVFMLEFRQDRIANLLAGFIFVLAFLTKQSALLVLFPVLLWTVLTEKGVLRWLMPTVALGGIGLSVFWLNGASDGWFNFYIFQLPAAHEIAWPLVVEFWRFDLLVHLPFALLALFMLFLPAHTKSEQRDKWWLLTLAVSFLGTAFFSRLHAGGWNNVLLPAYAILAVILATTLGSLFRSAGYSLRLLLLGACFLQFSLLIFDPRDHLPTDADQQAGDRLLARLQAFGGSVWIPHHSWLAVAAGGASSAHSMAMEDVLRGADPEIARMLDNEIRQDIAMGRWQLIVLDNPIYSEEIHKGYGSAKPAVADSNDFWTVTGLRTRPQLVYKKLWSGD